MNRSIFVAVLCMPALAVGMPPPDGGPAPIAPGDSVTRELVGDDSHHYLLQSGGTLRVTVDNLERGTILIIADASGERPIRSATWRGGPDGSYSAVLSVTGPATLEITPDELVAPPGRYRLQMQIFDPGDQAFAAERAMTMGADFHLRHYFEDADEREAALDQFVAAASMFGAAGYGARQADALFEAGTVCEELGKTGEALQHFAAAGAIWTTLNDQKGIAATENYRGLVNWTLGNRDEAITLMESAADRRSASGDTYFYAQAINNLGLVHRDAGNSRVAIVYFSNALEIWQGSVDLMAVDPESADFANAEEPPWLQTSLIAMNNIGWAHETLSELNEATRYYEQALKLSEFLRRGRTAAELRNNLGRVMYQIGDLQTALDHFEASLAYFSSAARSEVWAAGVHDNMALVYRATGDNDRAEFELLEALRLRTAERDPVGRAQTLQALAELGLETGRLAESQTTIQEALVLLDSASTDLSTEAAVHDLAGRIYLSNGAPDTALAHHDQAIDRYRATSNSRGEAVALTNRALTYHATGRSRAAIFELEGAIDIAEKADNRLGLFRSLAVLGRIQMESDQPEQALNSAKAAIEISEDVRSELDDPVLLREYAAVQRSAFDLLVTSAVRMGRIEEAWLTADTARARRFADVLGQSFFDVTLLDETDRLRHDQLLVRRDELTARSERHLSRKEWDAANAALRERGTVIDEIYRIQNRARGYSGRVRKPVSLPDLQTQLQDGDLVLEFFVGEYGAGVWHISRDKMTYRAIPELVDAGTDEAVASIRHLDGSPSSALSDLAGLLLADPDGLVAASSHLIVVPDGALHYVPFAALPNPAMEYREPLVASKNISYLPSVTALFELGTRDRNKGNGIAVVADPVFEISDQRVRQDASPKQDLQLARLDPYLTRGTRRVGRSDFPRLPGTRDEAEAIRGAAGDIDVLTVLDTDANRDMVLAGDLDDYSILHFATHGILDAEEPALSGLVLSGVTSNGSLRPRFLRSQDVAALRLKADLVVLSGCDTGLGRVVHGEGLVGLSRAFFYAGAEQVVSSLWQVPDRATAELMGHFYEEMLQNGQTPSAAMRSAQLKIREDRRWRAPYYWAAFIVQGDWR